MNNVGKMTIRWTAVFQILAITLLTSCAPIVGVTATSTAVVDTTATTTAVLDTTATNTAVTDTTATNTAVTDPTATSTTVAEVGPFNACHATGDTASPYEEVTFNTSAELADYRAQNPDDLSPIPVNGCPAILAIVSNGNISLCHASTNGETLPYSELVVSVDGLDGHGEHMDDIIPVPVDGCPTSPVLSTDKVTICHATGSQKHPYNKITVSVNGLNGHNTHSGDIIPAPADGCPITKP